MTTVLLVVARDIMLGAAVSDLGRQGFKIDTHRRIARKHDMEVLIVKVDSERDCDKLAGLNYDWVIFYDGCDRHISSHAIVILMSRVRRPPDEARLQTPSRPPQPGD